MYKSSGSRHITRLRGHITTAFSDMLLLVSEQQPNSEKKQDDTVHSKAQRIASDVQKTREHLDTKGLAESVPEIMKDLSAIVCIMEANLQTPVIRAKMLAESVERMKTEHWESFSRSANDSIFWKAVMSNAANALQMSAKDRLADAKLARARSILDDARMPRLVRPTPSSVGNAECDDEPAPVDAVVLNFSSISDGSVFSSYEESITLAAETVSMWSIMRREDSVEELKAWATSFMRNLVFIDEVLFLFLHSLMSKSGVLQACGALEEGCFLPDEAILIELVNDLDVNSIDDAPLKECVRRFANFVGTLPEDMREDMSKLASELSETVLRNVQSRDAMISSMSSLGKMTTPPADPETAINEWTSKQVHGQHKESFLERSVCLLTNVEQLLNSAPADAVAQYSGDDDIRMALDAGESRESFASSFKEVAALHSTLCGLPVWGAVRSLLERSLNAAVSACADSMNLVALGPGPADIDDETKLDQHMRGFFDPAEVSAAVAACGKIFAKASTKEWVGCEALQLVAKLAQAVPDSGFRADISCFAGPFVINQTGITTDKVALQGLANFAHRLMKITFTVAFLDLRYVRDAEPSVRDHRLKDDVENAVSFLRSEINAAISWCDQSGARLRDALAGAVNIDIVAVQSWLAKARSISKMVCAAMYDRHMQAVSTLSGEVDTLSPKYDHLITDDKFNVPMSKKQVLNHPGRSALSKKCVDLHTSIAVAVRLKSQWDVEDVSSADDADAVSASLLEMALDVFRSGKRAITVTAALNALYELTGETKKAALDKLASKEADLPKSLMAAVLTEKEKVDKSAKARASGTT